MYDVIIVGGGVAGLTGALYALRANKHVLLLEKNILGGQIINVSKVDNYPGLPNTSGFTIVNNLVKQVKSYENIDIKYEEVLSITKDKKVITKNNEYQGLSVIIANGLSKTKIPFLDNKPNISYCAICDGMFYKGKHIGIIGGSKSTIDDILYLSNIVSSITVFIKGDKLIGDTTKLANLTNVTYLYNTSIIDAKFSNKLESVVLDNQEEIKLDGLFVSSYGYKPDNQFLSNIVDLTSDGFIESIDDVKTNIEGVFVAGDTRKKELKQVVTAASDGAIAATLCIKSMK